MSMQELNNKFIEKYGVSEEEAKVFYAPGRVNLIGEHLDYNGGYVLPAALEFGTTLIVRPRSDSKVNFASTNFPYEASIDYSEIGKSKTGEWIDYPIGVMVELDKEKHPGIQRVRSAVPWRYSEWSRLVLLGIS